MAIFLHLKREPTVPLEAELLSPDVVANLSNAEIRALGDARNETLLNNMKWNDWPSVVYTRWGNWPQPYDAESMVIAKATQP